MPYWTHSGYDDEASPAPTIRIEATEDGEVKFVVLTLPFSEHAVAVAERICEAHNCDYDRLLLGRYEDKCAHDAKLCADNDACDCRRWARSRTEPPYFDPDMLEEMK